MLVKNAVKMLRKFGEVTHEQASNKELAGHLVVSLAPELQISISMADNAETTECGQIRAFHLTSGTNRKERSLNAAIRWCLNKKFSNVSLENLCGYPSCLCAGITHDRKFGKHCFVNDSVEGFGPDGLGGIGLLAYSRFCSNHPEALALVHGMVEGNSRVLDALLCLPNRVSKCGVTLPALYLSLILQKRLTRRIEPYGESCGRVRPRQLQMALYEQAATAPFGRPTVRAKAVVAVLDDLVVGLPPGVFFLVTIREVRLNPLFENFHALELERTAGLRGRGGHGPSIHPKYAFCPHDFPSLS